VIVNLTPHPVNIYGFEVPDRFEVGEYEPIDVYEPSGEVARIGEIDLGAHSLPGCDTPIEFVEYRHSNGLPAADGTWYIVSLAMALACGDRDDLLIPYREVRNLSGTVIGCRTLALPV